MAILLLCIPSLLKPCAHLTFANWIAILYLKCSIIGAKEVSIHLIQYVKKEGKWTSEGNICLNLIKIRDILAPLIQQEEKAKDYP